MTLNSMVTTANAPYKTNGKKSDGGREWEGFSVETA